MTDIAAFLGRFHPLLVHFPIALLVLAGAMELAAARRGDAASRIAAVRAPLLALAAASAVLAAGVGLLLGTSGGYIGPTYDWHLLLGVAVAAVSSVTALAAHHRARTGRGQAVVRSGLIVTLAALAVGGHLGATLTHGEGYLTEAAPAPLRGLVARLTGAAAPAPAHTGPAERAPVYPALVQPVLRAHCVRCHADGAARGRLALDTPEGIRAGGEHGAVLAPGAALRSELVRRVWLPPEHEDVMPPRGQRPVPPADAAILRWWVDAGAPFEQSLADIDVPPEVLPVIEARLGPLARGGPTIPPVALTAPDPARVDAIRARGIDVRPVADGSPFVQVRLDGRSPPDDDARVAALGAVAPHVLWLTIADTAVTDAALAAVARLPNLTRLDASRTAITDAGLRGLGPLAHLEIVNLYGTKVTDAGLAPLAALPRLRRVYLWDTGVTPAGVDRLRAAAPRLEIVLGDTPADAGAKGPNGSG